MMELFGLNLDELEVSQIGSWPLFLRVSLIIIVSLLTLWFGYLSSLSGQLNDCERFTQKIEHAKLAFSEAQFQASNLDAYKKEVAIVEAQLASLSEELPQQNELAGFLDDASQQAASTGVKLIAVQPLRDTNQGFYSETEVSLKITGNYNALGAFASNIAGMKRIVTIHDFKLKKSDGANENADGGILEFDLNSKTYWAGKDRHLR
jgi:type IV pilus assembly protein PilO